MIASKTPRSDNAWHEARHGEDRDALYKEAQKMEQELAIWKANAVDFDAARMKAEKERDKYHTELAQIQFDSSAKQRAEGEREALKLELEKVRLRLAEIAKWNAAPPIKHRGKWSTLLMQGVEEFRNLNHKEATALRAAARRMCIKVAMRKQDEGGWTTVVTSRPLRMATLPLPLPQKPTP